MKEDDKAFLVLFFGITPFCIFGIHDFIIGKRRRAVVHLLLFMAFFICTLMAQVITTMKDLGRPQVYNLISRIDTPEALANNIGMVAIGVSYLISIFEAISFFRARSKTQRYEPPSQPENPKIHSRTTKNIKKYPDSRGIFDSIF